MSVDILFVEDNQHKRARTMEYITTLHRSIEITEAWSFSSACQALEKNQYSLVLLDISLPTYDRVGSESGGRFRTFAGREILRKIVRSGSLTKILFITQYTAFSDRGTSYTFEGLKNELARECGENFAGMVFYDSSQTAWKEDAFKIIKALI
jgi:CheY-like chemotaxis protein